MKKLLLVLLLSIPVLFSVQAQTKQENIKELFALMQTDTMVVKMMNSMMPMLVNPPSATMDSTARSQRAELLHKVTTVLTSITTRLINEDMVVLYDKYFSEKDIQDMQVFYKSAAGKKMIQVTPELNKEMMMIMLTKYMPEMQRMFKD